MSRIPGLLLALSLLMVSMLSGCAGTMKSNYETPVVSLHTFKVLPQQNITPSFEIGLEIINPNRDPLVLEGMYYTIAIEGYEVLAGVSNDLPSVEPYGKADFTLTANVDIIRGINFITSLIQEPRDSFKYSFRAKLDTGEFNPKIIVEENGTFNLRNNKGSST